MLVAYLFVKLLGADVVGDGRPPKKKKKGKNRNIDTEERLGSAATLEMTGGNH